MKRIGKKLRSRAGESLAETLITVLVIAVALTMLAGMISATSSLVKTSEAKMDEYYEANAGLETLASGTEARISISDGEGTIESVYVITAKNDVFSDPVIAYRLKTSGDTGSGG